MIGSAPYSVTKHAAVGFAEWLSVTYGDRGVDVQAICPQGVQTRMLEEAGPLQDLLVPRLRTRRPSRSPTRGSRRSPTTASWCCPTPRWPATTPPGPPTPTAGWPGCAGCSSKVDDAQEAT